MKQFYNHRDVTTIDMHITFLPRPCCFAPVFSQKNHHFTLKRSLIDARISDDFNEKFG